MARLDLKQTNASDQELQIELRRISGQFGNVRNVRAFAPEGRTEAGTRNFVVEFERAMDALNAAGDLGCLLLGLSSIWVRIPALQCEAQAA
jgi:hypothetical protein